MYMPAFLPCPKCNTGPFVGRVRKGRLRGDCWCGYVTTGFYTDKYDLRNITYTDSELQSLNIRWNKVARDMIRIYGVDNESKT